MTDPLVSFIVPCFRQAHFLPMAVDSALNQTLKEIEVIVINDGSDDNTDEVCRQYGDRIVYISQENKGLPASRNVAIERARGKYLHFLDADDAVHPSAMEKMVAAMQGREDRLVWAGNHDFENEVTDTHLRKKIPRVGVKPFPRLIYDNFAPPVAILSSRKMAREVGGFECSLRSCEDWHMWIKLCLAGAEVVAIPEILTYYRRHKDSMSNNQSRMLEARTRVLFLFYPEIVNRPELLEPFGVDVLKVAHRLRRRWLVAQPSAAQISDISIIINDLEQRGFQLSRSALRRFLDRRLGVWGDRLALRYFKLFHPKKYEDYTWDPF